MTENTFSDHGNVNSLTSNIPTNLKSKRSRCSIFGTNVKSNSIASASNIPVF